MRLRAGDWVEVKSKEEILATLDKNGRLEEMPFMPQMFQYCGQKFKVYKRAHKTCDTVNTGKGRSIVDAVHLELRCDGEVYGGCQAACLLFWKTAWLNPVDNTRLIAKENSENDVGVEAQPVKSSLCTEADVLAGTQAGDPQESGSVRYSCQATQLPYFSTALAWWDVGQYLEDYTSGNTTVGQLLQGVIYAGYYSLVQAGIGLGVPLRWLYDKAQSIWGGIPYPRRTGLIPAGAPTPSTNLDLQPGELVRIKPYKEILATLNTENKNRGMIFDAELVPYCTGTYPVKGRVKKYIDEKTGRLQVLQNPAIILEGVWCRARYSDCRMYCPRSIFSWWREIWLERVSEQLGDATNTCHEIERKHTIGSLQVATQRAEQAIAKDSPPH